MICGIKKNSTAEKTKKQKQKKMGNSKSTNKLMNVVVDTAIKETKRHTKKKRQNVLVNEKKKRRFFLFVAFYTVTHQRNNGVLLAKINGDSRVPYEEFVSDADPREVIQRAKDAVRKSLRDLNPIVETIFESETTISLVACLRVADISAHDATLKSLLNLPDDLKLFMSSRDNLTQVDEVISRSTPDLTRTNEFLKRFIRFGVPGPKPVKQYKLPKENNDMDTSED